MFGSSVMSPATIAAMRIGSTLKLPVVSAFANMTSNFSGVPLAFAFIILLGFNGALTLLLKQAGLIGDFNLYSKSGLILVYSYFQIPLGVLLL